MNRRPLRVPELGLDKDVSLRLSLWLVRTGEPVRAEQSLAEIVAGQVVVDLPSAVDGVLVEKLVDEDQDIEVGQTLGWIESR